MPRAYPIIAIPRKPATTKTGLAATYTQPQPHPLLIPAVPALAPTCFALADPGQPELVDNRPSAATQVYPTAVAASGRPFELIEHQLAVGRSRAVAGEEVAERKGSGGCWWAIAEAGVGRISIWLLLGYVVGLQVRL